jgi:flagellar hook-basal body complex protein FliE
MSNMISNISSWFPPQAAAPSRNSSPRGQEGGFTTSLTDAIDQVEQIHSDAQQQVSQLLQGNRQDVHNVMIAVEKADVAFQLMMQVRNKIVNAYEEVSKLQF